MGFDAWLRARPTGTAERVPEGLDVDGWPGALARALAHRFRDLEQQVRASGLRRA